MNGNTDTLTVRLVIFGLIAAVIIGMSTEAWLIARLIGSSSDQVKDIAVVMLAFGQLPSAALGALSAVLVSTRSGAPEPAHLTQQTTTTVTDPPSTEGLAP